MTPQSVLIEVLERIGAKRGTAVVISDHELTQWPNAVVSAMKSQRLLTKARPASSAVCAGCERECVMPVHVLTNSATAPSAFVVCDKRFDINRVTVPVSQLEQWQTSGDSVAALLAGLLEVHRTDTSGADASRWEIGLLKGAKHSSHIVLVADGKLVLSLAGHSVPVTDVLSLNGDAFQLDRRTLNRLVDQPVSGAGDVESAAQRRQRLKKRVQKEKAKGTKGFLKAVAKEEGISDSRLKQLLKDDAAPNKPGSRR